MKAADQETEAGEGSLWEREVMVYCDRVLRPVIVLNRKQM